MTGILLIDKPSGPSSFDVLRTLKKRFDTGRMGYLGTLDPLASGLLIVFVGKATKLIRYCEGLSKQYWTRMELGKSSETYDRLGEHITLHQDVSMPSEQDLLACLKRFTGPQWQVQPAFSALKFEGKRAYEHAREGKTIDLGKRQVEITSLELASYDPPFVELEMSCSSGTYVRSLVHEMGEDLETGAMMLELRRTGVGPFLAEEARAPEETELSAALGAEAFLDRVAQTVPSLAKEKAYLLRQMAP